ncbi:hypothetical protein Tco_0876245 [Tanacetum coccineum]|uniref:Uncharacterized protein n=1 Tax=Tanacetum coccineum TaxID=301880 RepID=A0ABQ5BTE1_9ASTR
MVSPIVFRHSIPPSTSGHVEDTNRGHQRNLERSRKKTVPRGSDNLMIALMGFLGPLTKLQLMPLVQVYQTAISTDDQNEGTDEQSKGTDDHTEEGSATQPPQPPTSTIFGDDETIAQVLLNMSQAKAVSREKEKGVDIIDQRQGTKKMKGDESESESNVFPEAEKKFKQLASDEEMARKVQEEWEGKFGGNTKLLYEKIKRSDEDFISIGSAKDERLIKKINEKGFDSSKNEVFREEDKEEEGTKKRKGGHIKMIARKKARKQSDIDSDDEHKKCLKIVTFESILDSEIMEKKSVIARLNKVSSPDGDYLVIYRANGNFRAFNYLMEVLHIFDRQDLFHLDDLIRDQFSEVTLDGFELILWGDLKIMMESSTEGNEQSDFWSGQQDWKIVTWRLYESCGVCILEFEDGIVIHMLVERRYPLSKDLLQMMLDLGLEVERESSVALDLIRFIKQQIDEE